MPYLGYQEARDFYGNELTEEELDSIYYAAAELVESLAPAPDPEPENYPLRARVAERMLGAWLSAGGHLYLGIGGAASESVNIKQQRAEEIVAGAMGNYFAGMSGVGLVFHREPGE